ncbi:MAG: c-type cytochrome [Pseudomonadota bacterium]
MKHTILIAATLGLTALAPLAGQAAGPDIAGLAKSCNNCHGDGMSVGQSMPSIGGLSATYLEHVMQQWKTGERYSAVMGRLIKGYTDQEIAALADYFSKQPWKPAPQTLDAKLVAHGKDAAERCSSCHGDTGVPEDDETPRLTGQWAKYMELELMKYRDEAVTMPHKKMRTNAKKLAPEDVAAATAHYASQQK